MQAIQRRLLSELHTIRAGRAFSQLHLGQHLSCRYLGASASPITPVTQLPLLQGRHLSEVQSLQLLASAGRLGSLRSLSALTSSPLNSKQDWLRPGVAGLLGSILSKHYSTSGKDGSKGEPSSNYFADLATQCPSNGATPPPLLPLSSLPSLYSLSPSSHLQHNPFVIPEL